MSTTSLSNIRKELKKEQRSLLFKRFLSNKLLLTGSFIMLFVVGVALIGPFFLSYTPYQMVVENRLSPPSAEHLLGTDNFGRDLFSRVVYGAQISLGVGLAVAVITSVVGLVIGLLASYYKTLDHILMRICDGLMAIPGILFAIALMAALGPQTQNVIIALSIVFTPHIARVVRSKALSIREETYVEAMRAQGASPLRIIFLHIAPNTISPLVVQATFIFADSIITEAALSFLGAGVPTPDPSWGNILYDGKLVIFNAWWMTVFPGIMIILAVIGLNFVGDGLRDMIDPHTKPRSKKKRVNLFRFNSQKARG
ncbi:ABC transporter permease [Geomicrobium sediminis]|uniref:Peptide/nickel transport system permease protein n=1 Tax=Geomicrobium sediminis TaxID=1347788 RepID=A0ABS2PIG5_9BACL|nr:ABC transporter permease [Geomicrobium sediminis]MBM7634746.1 peptide/nickel transport system permease protein [Geomicrobium sediminis]